MEKERLTASWAEAQRHLEEALSEVSALMEHRFTLVGSSPEPGGILDQRGLSDGAKVVRDYMAQHEWGLALEHLCYMVVEADLSISAKTYTSLQAAGRALQMDTPALRNIKTPVKP